MEIEVDPLPKRKGVDVDPIDPGGEVAAKEGAPPPPKKRGGGGVSSKPESKSSKLKRGGAPAVPVAGSGTVEVVPLLPDVRDTIP